jgi:type VII secretion protein EccE
MATSRAGRFGLGQAVAVELVVMVVVAAAYALPAQLAAVTVVSAVLLLLLVIGRFGGRWWYEVVFGWMQLHERRASRNRAALTARSAGPYWAEFASLAPHLVVRTVTDRNVRIGVGEDELGWFGAIALTPHDGLSRGDGTALRLDSLARLAGEPAAPVSAVQVVMRHTPLPSPAIDPRSPCAQSYRELRDALSVPPHRDVWIAVRLGLREAATAAADYGGDEVGIHRALGAALTRIGTTLTSYGLAHRILDGIDLQQALVGVYGPDPYDGGLTHVPATAHETWSSWRAIHGVHVCFAVVGWPSNAPPDVFSQLARVPGAASVCTAVVLGAVRGSGGDQVATRTLVRVVAAPAAVGACVRDVRAIARSLGVKLVRLDGEQAAAVYATTPTAASDGWGLYQ